MTSTREHRNAGKVDDAITAIGVAISVAENTLEILAGNLPDEYEGAANAHVANLRAAHSNLTEEIGL